jgi:2-iminobutanoate/2-iminopropanoate deaminase
MKKIVSIKEAPAAIGPYSQAVRADDCLFCSGQLGIDPSTGKLDGTDVASQAKRSLENIKALLASEGMTTADVIKTTVFLTDMGAFKSFNEVYAKYFTSEPPARSCVAVAALPLGALVEIEVIARRP